MTIRVVTPGVVSPSNRARGSKLTWEPGKLCAMKSRLIAPRWWSLNARTMPDSEQLSPAAAATFHLALPRGVAIPPPSTGVASA